MPVCMRISFHVSCSVVCWVGLIDIVLLRSIVSVVWTHAARFHSLIKTLHIADDGILRSTWSNVHTWNCWPVHTWTWRLGIVHGVPAALFRCQRCGQRYKAVHNSPQLMWSKHLPSHPQLGRFLQSQTTSPSSRSWFWWKCTIACNLRWLHNVLPLTTMQNNSRVHGRTLLHLRALPVRQVPRRYATRSSSLWRPRWSTPTTPGSRVWPNISSCARPRSSQRRMLKSYRLARNKARG